MKMYNLTWRLEEHNDLNTSATNWPLITSPGKGEAVGYCNISSHIITYHQSLFVNRMIWAMVMKGLIN